MRPIASRSRWTFRYPVVASVLLLMGSGFCTSTALHRAHAGHTGKAKPNAHRWRQVGRASWYGPEFQGQKTASGQTFNMHAMTCANRSLPLGSLIRVTNLRNQRSVVVRVNDRGPMIASRIVDLSYAAARAIRLHGVGRVSLELIDADPTASEVAQLSWPQTEPR